MKQSGTSSVSDFLSLQHLGLILEELSRQSNIIMILNSNVKTIICTRKSLIILVLLSILFLRYGENEKLYAHEILVTQW